MARFCSECGLARASPSAKASPSVYASPEAPSVGERSIRYAPRAAPKRVSAPTAEAIPRTAFVVPAAFAHEFRSLLRAEHLSPQAICVVDQPGDLESALYALHAQYAAHPPNYLCLLGTWDDIPARRIPSPLRGDDDEFCPCDLAWGLADPAQMDDDPTLDGIPVGRIPVLDADVIHRLFCYELPSTRAEHAVNLAVSAECWADATHEIVRSQGGYGALSRRVAVPVQRSLLPGQPVLLSPHWREVDLVPVVGGNPHRETTLLFNVHGSGDDPSWVGESEDGEYVRIFSPDQVQDFSGTILVTEACYGGAMGYDSPSMVESFFRRGGLAFLGASVIAYGSDSESLAGADLMAQFFLRAVHSGDSFGQAHAIARRQIVDSDPWANDVSMKTLVSFNLYGLPWMKKAGTAPAAHYTRESASSVLSSIRNARSMASRPGSSGVLDRARTRYRERLPEFEQTFLSDAAEILNKLQGFRDFETISRSLNKFADPEMQLRLERVSHGGESGYRLRLKAVDRQKKSRYKIIITDAEGRIRKSISSKDL